jgi:hypothetical protein
LYKDVLEGLKLDTPIKHDIDKLQLPGLLFADDTALFAKNPNDLQLLLDQWRISLTRASWENVHQKWQIT